MFSILWKCLSWQCISLVKKGKGFVKLKDCSTGYTYIYHIYCILKVSTSTKDFVGYKVVKKGGVFWHAIVCTYIVPKVLLMVTHFLRKKNKKKERGLVMCNIKKKLPYICWNRWFFIFYFFLFFWCVFSSFIFGSTIYSVVFDIFYL